MRKVVAIVLIFFSPVLHVAAQVPFVQEYFLLRKNESLQVNCILQEQAGFMWFGTSKGLYHFNGKNHQRYTTKEGMSTDGVTALAEDSLGRIWIGYDNGKIGYFQSDSVHILDPPEGSATKTVSDILFDSKGNLWFATHNDGLYYLKANRLYRIDEAEGLPDLFIYDLAEDAAGNIWAGTDGGAAVCRLQGNHVSVDVIDYNDGLPDNIIRKIVPDRGAVLLGTEDAGILRYDLKSKKFEFLLDEWMYGPVSDLEIKGNKLWIGTPQKGLLVYDKSERQAVLYPHEETQAFKGIRKLQLDVDGNIWIGTKSGIARTPGDDLQFMERPEATGTTNILAVTVDHDDNIWFSSKDGLLKRKLNKPGENLRPLANTPYKNYTVISLYTDSKGFVWAGLYGEGALRIDPVTGHVRHLNKELRNGNILSIAGYGNTVWLGTLGGTTKVTLADNETLEITNFSSDDGLASDFIYQVFPEKDERVWFATDGQGVAMMNRNGFQRYDQALPSKVVYGMAQDAGGRLWVNVQGNGLYIFDGRNYQPCDSTLELRDKNIHALVADRSGNIVVMNDAGMDIIDVQRKKVIYLGEEVGIRDKIANLNAVGVDSKGNIYFGTTGGIIKYTSDPDYLNHQPRPRLTSLAVFDDQIEFAGAENLRYDENNITINYLGVWSKNPDGLLYSYKMENYDRDWITTKNQSVTYSRLPPGSYTFRVKVSESSDFRDAQETSFVFSIQPPIWQTIPFYIFSIFALAAGVYFVVKGRERKLRRYNELLEEKVQLRTKEIQQQSDEIQTQNEEISAQSEEILRINENLEEIVQERTRDLERKNKALEEYAFINAHKLRSPVATILGLINLISKTRLDSEGAEINRRLQNTADELDGIVSSITKAIERSERKLPKLKDE
ncbi:MAG TPA: two-component regulator propeller domain-containing protein [Chryseolinea sp.]